MLTVIIVISVLLLLNIIYTAACIININKIHKELDDVSDLMERHTQDYAKIVKFQLEQIRLNEEIIKKFAQLDEKEVMRNLYELQRNNKIGQA